MNSLTSQCWWQWEWRSWCRLKLVASEISRSRIPFRMESIPDWREWSTNYLSFRSLLELNFLKQKHNNCLKLSVAERPCQETELFEILNFNHRILMIIISLKTVIIKIIRKFDFLMNVGNALLNYKVKLFDLRAVFPQIIKSLQKV